MALACLALWRDDLPAQAPLVIEDVAVASMGATDFVETGRTVVIIDGRIAAITPAGTAKIPEGARRVSGTGGLLVPGFWNGHVHLFTAEGTERDLLARARNVLGPRWLEAGVTTVVDLGAPTAIALAWRTAARARDIQAPRAVVSGQLLGGVNRYAPGAAWNAQVGTADAAVDSVDALLAAGVDLIKVHDFLRADAWGAIVDRAAARDAIVTGHLSPSVGVADAVARGHRHIQHLGPELLAVCTPDARARVAAWYDDWIRNGWTSFAEGSTRLWADRDRATCEATLRGLAAEGLTVTPTVSHRLVMEAAQAAEGRWIDETAREVCRGSVEQWGGVEQAARDRYRATLHEWLRAAHAAGVRLVAGTDGPGVCLPPGSLALELEEFVAAGIPPLAALRAATRNAADAHGSETLGRIEVGAMADLVLLDADVLTDIRLVRAPRLVVRGGRIVAGNN